LNDADWVVREAVVEAMAVLPEARPQLIERLGDDDPFVRQAASEALNPAAPALPLAALPQALQCLPAVGVAAASSVPTTSAGLLLCGRLAAFVASPAAFDLDADPDFTEVVLGWLCLRLCWASPMATMDPANACRIFGELRAYPSSLLRQDTSIIRLAMDSSLLPAERLIHPLANTCDAWRVGQHLHSQTPPGILLVCADVDFDDLPAPPALEPGQACWGPLYFGFRLPRSPAP